MVKFEAEKIKDWYILKKIYLKLSENACMLGKYKLGLLYAQRSLELAWDQKDIKSELLSMDMMGRCYFNMEKLELARYFHLRVFNIKFIS